MSILIQRCWGIDMVAEKSFRNDLLMKLVELARGEPIRAITEGDTAVGMTLLDALGIEYSSVSKPTFHGIVINASRKTYVGVKNRVNLFAQVPNWDLSYCKSSREILARYGYDAADVGRRLFCTVSARGPNPQGLQLQVNRGSGFLNEVFYSGKKYYPVATWALNKLNYRLVDNHPESLWVTASVFEKNDKEYYQYREVIYTGPPNTEIFPELLASGTVTIDHLIDSKNGKVREKGPLFKINPDNLSLLFPSPRRYDLMTIEGNVSWER